MQSNSSLAVVRNLLYNHNPFYVISALLVLGGVWRSVAGQETLAAGWPMLGLLCGYLALLAAAAWAIIRWGGVWQDARTLLVVIVLMFVALSMSFDALAVLDLEAGRQMLVCGLAFAIGLSEVVLRGLSIRLSWFYRGPYYAALGLLFLYPLWLADLVRREAETPLAGSLMLFPVLGAMVLLALWPAARWGRARAWAKGTPWSWPLFPWTLFFFLALGLGARTYSLAYAFESNLAGESGFRAYWLSPLVLAGAVLLLEMGRSASHRLTQTVALLGPLGLIPLALLGAGENATQLRFLALLQDTLTGPALLTAWLLLAFYGWAWLRGARLAEAGLMAALLLAASVDAATVEWRMLSLHSLTPLGVVLIVQLVQSIQQGASWRMAIVAGLVIAASCAPLRATPLVQTGYAPLHLMLLVLAGLGLQFDDRLARRLRRGAPYLLPALALLATAGNAWLFPGVPLALHLAYVAALAGLAGLYWRRERRTANLAAVLATMGLSIALAAQVGYAQLENTPLAAGRDWLAGGLLCLAVGLLISLAKGGVLRTAWTNLVAWNRQFQATPERAA